MSLTEDQWTKMYDLSVANSTHIEWIRKTLENTTKGIKDCEERLGIVENEQAFIKGHMARFAGGVAAICAIVVNGVLWGFSHFGVK
jgi:hypothetical protein